MFGSFTRPLGNDSPAPEATNTATAPEAVETVTTETESEAVTNDSETPVESAAPDTDSETNRETDTETETVKKPLRGFERRIEKFNQKLSQKDQEIEYWRRAALGGTQSEAQPVAASAAPDTKPVFANYSDIETYTEALTDWKVQQALQQVTQRQEVDTRVRSYETRLREFEKQTPDFQEVMQEFVEDYGDRTVPEIVQVAMESTVGPQLAYYLAKNTAEVDRIAALQPHRRLLELGKIEDRLSQPRTADAAVRPEAKKVSKAAAPIAGIKGSSTVDTRSIYDDLPYAQWVKLRSKK